MLHGSFSAKLKDLYIIEKSEYIFLKLTPSNAIKNNSSTKLITSLSQLYTSIDERIKFEENRLHYKEQSKLGFFIHMQNGIIQFFMIVPEIYSSLFKERIIDTWSNHLTIEKVDNLPMYKPTCSKCFMGYKNRDAFSLECDCRSNVLLSSILNTTHIMKEDDQVGVLYNFYPTDNKSWKSKYDKTLESYNNDGIRDQRRFNLSYIVIMLCNIIIKTTDIIFSSIGLGTSKSNKTNCNIGRASIETNKKRDHTIVNAQILCFSQSNNKQRESNNLYSVSSAFECLDGDNKLIMYRYNKTTVNLLDTKIKGADVIKIMDREGQNFISLPGRELIRQYNKIDHTKVLETQVPIDLQSGVMRLGENVYKGNRTKAYLPNTKNEKNLALVIIAPTRSGKSTLISNLCHDSGINGECNINFDFCGKCETSDILSNTPNLNVLEVDCSKYDSLQGLGYNEIKSSNDPFERYRDAKVKTSQLISLINSVNADDKDLKTKMGKHLSAVANIVFICGGEVYDVIEALQDHKVRHRFIDLIPKNQLENLKNYISYALELDDKNHSGSVTGTKYNLITGIMDRIEKLNQNTYIELMIKKPCKNNFNLIEEIQKNQTINFRMPESMFPTREEKDTYVTYWLSKLWISLKYRLEYIPADKIKKVNIFIDELYQTNHAEAFVKGILSQMAKFNAKMIISCHYLNQLTIIREELKSANCSYMLISGCNKQNYNELCEELDPYQVEDLLSLKEFHSLNLIKMPDGYEKFVTALPKPLNCK